MAVFNLFLSTILLPVIAIVLLSRRRRKPFANWLPAFVMASGVTGFSVLAAPWGWFGFPLRIVLVLAFLTAVVVSLRRETGQPVTQDSAVRMLVKIAIGFFFGGVGAGVLRAHAVPAGALNLGFPLAKGTFLVAHGGSNPAGNIHFSDARQRYAVDLVEVNGAGFRARGILPDDPRDYFVFGSDVISPCAGQVFTAVDQFPDGIPDPKHPLGNHLVLRCGDVDVTLAQLQKGSLGVKAGTPVAPGAPLARAGHSGLSGEPHLHVHVERNGAAVPATFDGRWLVRNDLVWK